MSGMDQSSPGQPAIFDPHAERVALTAIFRANGGTASAARPAIVDHLAHLVKGARGGVRNRLERDGDGRRCAETLARFQDELIHLAYDYTIAHVYRAADPTDKESLSVVATGGYGRGLLAPGSDIDLLFLLPKDQLLVS
jgi:[protein-PII] uridylyltransferase